MRSEYVFAASKEISNRFLLCRVASVSARRLHRDSTQPSQTINKSLQLIATSESGEQNCAVKDAINRSENGAAIPGSSLASGLQPD
jgi:hypothetical protein